ncbi:MAG TPA: phage minor head protein [Rhizomicrobium sp.]|nr:phage minor head protein [Rhizomicrobium sp.]
MPIIQLRDISPKAAIGALSRRQANPIPTFSWLDVWQQEHSQMFTAAKTAGFDVLDDISAAVDDALANGESFEGFKKKLTPILQDKGWWGRAPVVDPATGETIEAQLGSDRRLQIIYDTNMRMSYAAGTWQQLTANKEGQPYLMYSCVHDNRTRPLHRLWDGTTLPIDHPWWETHYPPNGWRCRCQVIALSQARYDAMKGAGIIKTVAPKSELVSYTNPRTGEVSQVPKGIDPGFGYNAGKAFLAALAGQPAPPGTP